MSDASEKYHERLLHWIWSTLRFSLSGLHTTCGKQVTIVGQGDLNPTDGPDFRNARLQIGDLEWYGDIEFHWSAKDWTRHSHHTDPRYNSVILHVVYHDPEEQEVARQDGSSPLTLHLQPFLPKSLDQLISAFDQTDRLPCSGQIKYISEDAIRKQFEKAHREYFEEKADFLLEFYESGLPPATAWKRVLTLGLFDGLGISLNREPMLQVGRELFSQLDQADGFPPQTELRKKALKLAGFKNNGEHTEIIWNHKGCRPNNHPELRLQQASALMWHIQQHPFKKWYRQAPEENWQKLLEAVDIRPGIGSERSEILYGVVFLPALWLLGNLFQIHRLKQRAYERWRTHRAPIPPSLLKLFEQSDIPAENYRRKLGAVYQLKHYCRSRRCDQCKVLKEIISS